MEDSTIAIFNIPASWTQHLKSWEIQTLIYFFKSDEGDDEETREYLNATTIEQPRDPKMLDLWKMSYVRHLRKKIFLASFCDTAQANNSLLLLAANS